MKGHSDGGLLYLVERRSASANRSPTPLRALGGGLHHGQDDGDKALILSPVRYLSPAGKRRSRQPTDFRIRQKQRAARQDILQGASKRNEAVFLHDETKGISH